MSDEVRDHKSCTCSTPFKNPCMSTGVFASTSSCWLVSRGVYDDVNGMALILSVQDTRSTVSAVPSGAVQA